MSRGVTRTQKNIYEEAFLAKIVHDLFLVEIIITS